MPRVHPDELRYVTGHGGRSAKHPEMMEDCIKKTVSWLIAEGWLDNFGFYDSGRSLQWLQFADEYADHFKHAEN